MSSTESPVGDRIKKIETAISELERSLAPAEPDVVDSRLRVLIAVLPWQDPGQEGVEIKIEAYRYTLSGISENALTAAVQMILRGKVPEIDKRFMPSPGELSEVCAKLEGADRRRLDRLRDELRIRRGLPEPEMSPAEQERRAKRAAAAADSIKAGPLRREQSWMDKPMVVEEAAEMSPELKAVLRRKWHIMGGENLPPTREHAA